ncbi:unnamed protein product, partial [Rotaria sp. Silwood1]
GGGKSDSKMDKTDENAAKLMDNDLEDPNSECDIDPNNQQINQSHVGDGDRDDGDGDRDDAGGDRDDGDGDRDDGDGDRDDGDGDRDDADGDCDDGDRDDSERDDSERDDGDGDRDDDDRDRDNGEDGNGDGESDCDNGEDGNGAGDQQEDNGCGENQKIDAAEETPPANPDDEMEGAASSKPSAGKSGGGKSGGEKSGGRKSTGGKSGGQKPRGKKSGGGKFGGKMDKTEKHAVQLMKNGLGGPNSKGCLDMIDPNYRPINQLHMVYLQFVNGAGCMQTTVICQFYQQIGISQRGIMCAQRAIQRINQFNNGTANFINLMALLCLIAQIC